MGEIKCKYRFANPLVALAEGIGGVVYIGQDLYNYANEIVEDKRIQICSLSISAINVLVSSDPVLASCKFATKQLQMMFPRKKRGYTIDYRNPFYEKCPTHHCKTYHVKETSTLVWCPLCMDFSEIEE